MFSKFIPKQMNIPYIGAMYDLICRCFTIYSAVTSLFMSYVFYKSSDEVMGFFGSYWLFLLTLIFGLILMCALVWVFLIASHNKYLQEQAIIDGRSPTFDEIQATKTEVLEIRKEVTELRVEITELKELLKNRN